MSSKLYLEMNNFTLESFSEGEISIVEKNCGATMETLNVEQAYKMILALQNFIFENHERRSAYYE